MTCNNCLFSRLSSKRPGHETNEELTARLMRFAKSGPMMQLFILTAIHKYAAQCVKEGAAKFDTGFMSGAAWVRSAQEALDNLDRHLKVRPADFEAATRAEHPVLLQNLEHLVGQYGTNLIRDALDLLTDVREDSDESDESHDSDDSDSSTT